MNQAARKRGFTLIELVVTMAVVGILAAISLPMYTEQVNKSRRAEGKSAILQTSALQERYFTVNNAYSSTLTATASHYTISIETPTPQSFRIIAAPRFTDPKCQNLSYDHLGNKGASGSAGVAYCW